MRPVRVAQNERGVALLESGIEPGDRIVVDGQYRLKADSRVKAVAPGQVAPPPQGS